MFLKKTQICFSYELYDQATLAKVQRQDLEDAENNMKTTHEVLAKKRKVNHQA